MEAIGDLDIARRSSTDLNEAPGERLALVRGRKDDRARAVGHDRDRDDIRTFRLSRIAPDVTATGPAGAVRRPDGLDLRAIVANAGEESSVILAKVKEHKGNYGYNAANHDFGDMIKLGILDPTKVTRTALQAAVSVASLMITTEVMIAEKPEDKPAPGGMPGGMGDMGGMGMM